MYTRSSHGKRAGAGDREKGSWCWRKNVLVSKRASSGDDGAFRVFREADLTGSSGGKLEGKRKRCREGGGRDWMRRGKERAGRSRSSGRENRQPDQSYLTRGSSAGKGERKLEGAVGRDDDEVRSARSKSINSAKPKTAVTCSDAFRSTSKFTFLLCPSQSHFLCRRDEKDVRN